MTEQERPLALVTGASSGIGRALAVVLARLGHNLILVARRRPRLEQLAEELAGHGATCQVLVADLTRPGGLDQVEAVVADLPRLDLLVNNAGFSGYRAFSELDLDRLDSLLQIHCRAAARLTRRALPSWLAGQHGGVINVASLLGFSAAIEADRLPQRAIYSGCKAFLIAFTRALAGELRGTGVRAMVVCPGVVATEFHSVDGATPAFPSAMTAANCAAAIWRGYQLGETICIPGLEEVEAIAELDRAGARLLGYGNRAEPASRYSLSSG